MSNAAKTKTPSLERTLDHVRKHGPLMLGVLSGDGQYDRAAETLIEQGALIEVRETRKFIFDDGFTVTFTVRYAT